MRSGLEQAAIDKQLIRADGPYLPAKVVTWDGWCHSLDGNRDWLPNSHKTGRHLWPQATILTRPAPSLYRLLRANLHHLNPFHGTSDVRRRLRNFNEIVQRLNLSPGNDAEGATSNSKLLSILFRRNGLGLLLLLFPTHIE